ncbi:MAG: hypothetical protein ACREQF_13005 [Candidatus Binataceae bacterium]
MRGRSSLLKVAVLILLVALWTALPVAAAPGGVKGKPKPTATPSPTPTPNPTPTPVCNQKTFQGRPIKLGVSGGNINDIGGGYCCVGTLGSLVTDGANDFILSNNHVLARQSTATSSASAGEDIIQPGLADSGCFAVANSQVADLTNWVPIAFGGTNTVDAAIAQIRVGAVNIDGEILNIGKLGASVATPTLNMAVQKMGRTTCLTKSTIAAVNVNVSVGYSNVCGAMASGTAFYTGQIMISSSTFSAGGDSGSLIVTRESCPRAVGLLFAGSSTTTIANPIGAVLSSLGVSMVGTCVAAATASAPTVSSSTASAGRADAAIEAATKVRDRHEANLRQNRGVLGTGIARGAAANATVIEVYVEQDTPEVRAQIPATLDGIATRVVETGEIVAY